MYVYIYIYMSIYIYIHTYYTYIYIYIYIYILPKSLSEACLGSDRLVMLGGVLLRVAKASSPDHAHFPATWKHGWSKHGFSRIQSSSNMVIINIFAICYLRMFWWYSAKTIFTPTMFSRGWTSPNLPTKITPAKIRWVETFGKEIPMDMRIPPLEIKIMFGSNTLKSRILVWRFVVQWNSMICR